MIDNAAIAMSQGSMIAAEHASGVNDNMIKSHFHSFFELYYLESGERYHVLPDSVVLLKAGDLVLFPPSSMHHSYGKSDVPFDRIVVYFRPEAVLSEGLLKELGRKTIVCSVSGSGRYSVQNLLTMLLKETEAPEPHSAEYKKSMLNMLLVTVLRNAEMKKVRKEKDLTAKIAHYIYCHYAEDIDLESLSREFYLSRFYMCRKFREETGSTIIRYLNTTRILHARRLMMESDMNFTEICGEVGFKSLTHFNRICREITGKTPSAIRREIRAV